MKVIYLKSHPSEEVGAFGSHGAVISRLLRSRSAVAADMMRYAPGAILGRHRAQCPQMLLITAGEGWASGNDGIKIPVSVGQAVLWTVGEEHESGSATGMTAVIIQAASYEAGRETVFEHLPDAPE
ncbi:hypothetical protein AB0N06_34820 [Streptomyces sp. NPDC051020]|uniref:hypothetical protein n=1 Tax=Streptomyces sp. NPDC051020 TaxID=3155409 RepID=UPI003441B053